MAEPSTDKVTFADYSHAVGRPQAPLMAALRVKLGVKKSELDTRLFAVADLEAGIADLKGKK